MILRVLILESLSGGLQLGSNTKLLPEGFAMLRTMVSEFSEAGFNVVTVIDKRLAGVAGWLDADVRVSRDGLSTALRCGADIALAIAPERGRELEEITTKLRKNGTVVLGPREDTIRVCADKWLTHSALQGIVPQPRTWKKFQGNGRTLVKPVDGIGCEGIKFATSFQGGEDVIFQEFLEGEHASCCLLMGEEKGSVLSLNKQEILIQQGRFNYNGGITPLDHPLKEKCAEIALRAGERLHLRGYCGVDLVLGASPYFIEVNPRVTTSFVALARVLQANLGEILVDVLIDGASVPKPQLDGFSLMRIPKAKEKTRINIKGLGKLREIPGVISPPLTLNGTVQKGSPLFLLAESGSTIEGAMLKLETTLNEAAALIGVDQNAIAWS
jgi:hypothetical protein